ncbi:MAG: UDP-N-acetylmuramoyl-tripeptide--D-alanyl-D-alanine ligase [Candidatus Pacebacteria bacterium]|jgi:UDP-N-acetylmuramoyl-tripeptide--D-alanyl-D-alanine ligase|nr:UDP-N-acetylmuramoyl-tripeptide--D-alanyl-D-alanine ligase [Candidatus Paceibacterota bacterium]MDD5721771.1 UDP-N-acetylmuramoyl-tripeptide--D-alanyl-D-alanine ligase [Candidatus Paceibacterota bacterium]
MKRKLIQYKLKFLAKLILWRYKPLVIGVTGSVGKTSTKEAIFTILNKKYRTARNIFNLNTEIGLPLTIIQGKDAKRNVLLWFYNFLHALRLFIFKSKNYPEVLILEMSEDAPGVIKYLVDLAQPTIGIITFIGSPPVHLEHFKNTSHFIEEISYLPQRLLLKDTLILNADNEPVVGLREKTMAKTIFYGFDEKADVKVSNYKLIFSGKDLSKTGMSFRLEYKGSFVPVRVKNVFGKPQAYALAAGAAVGLSLGMNLVEIAEAIKDHQIPEGRTKFMPGINNTWILDDAYNASPDSVLASLDLIESAPAKRRIVALGAMKELSNLSEQAHQLIGLAIAEKNIDVFIGIGEEMIKARESALKKNPKIQTFWFKNSEQARETIKGILQKGDLILIKGSRAMQMEKITQEIKLENN